MENKQVKMTTIGGQALIEGLMMLGPKDYCIAVRKENGEIHVEKHELPQKKFFDKIPFIRGSFVLFRQMIIGTKALMRAADLVEIEEEPSKFELFLEKIFGDKLKEIVIFTSVMIALAMSVGLFIVLPSVIADFFPFDNKTYTGSILFNLVEGAFRVIIFMGYLISVSKFSKEMRRVWGYHGAEHKAIHCYENGEDITVENIQKYSPKHPRCGTSFLFMVVIVSIIMFSFTGWHSIPVNIGIRLLLLPVVAGITYEIFKIIGKKSNKFFDILKKPGMMFQNFTTEEPDDDMVEVAVEALKGVLNEDKEIDNW